MKDKHPSQRGWFAYELYQQMKKNPDIVLLVGDLGYRIFDKHFEDFPDRCINSFASEQAMVGIAVGLAQEGKIPFVYSITPFLIYRPFETIMLYLWGENANVKLVGSGRDTDYSVTDGPSHDASRIRSVMDLFGNIDKYYPMEKKDIPGIVKSMIEHEHPSFLSLKR